MKKIFNICFATILSCFILIGVRFVSTAYDGNTYTYQVDYIFDSNIDVNSEYDFVNELFSEKGISRTSEEVLEGEEMKILQLGSVIEFKGKRMQVKCRKIMSDCEFAIDRIDSSIDGTFEMTPGDIYVEIILENLDVI